MELNYFSTVNYLLYIILVIVIFVPSFTWTTYQGFVDDYRIYEADLDGYSSHYIEEVLEFNQEMPMPCRTDICDQNEDDNMRKGKFVWPETYLGQMVELRCPYSVYGAVYTHRLCNISVTGVAHWEQPDFEHSCPDPPLAQVLQQFTLKINNSGSEFKRLDFEEMLRKVKEVFTLYKEAPVSVEDIKLLVTYLLRGGDIFQQISTNMASNLISLLNTLMEDKFKQTFEILQQEDNIVYSLNEYLSKLPLQIESRLFNLKLPNLMVYTIHVLPGSIINISNIFPSGEATIDRAVYSPSISVHVLDNMNNEDGIKVGLSVMRDFNIWYQPLQWIQLQDLALGSAYKRRKLQGINMRTGENKTVNRIPALWEFDKLGSLIFLSTNTGTSDLEEGKVQISYSVQTCKEANVNDCQPQQNRNPTCVKSTESSKFKTWSTSRCIQNKSFNTEGFTNCECIGPGAYAVFKKIGNAVHVADDLPTEDVNTMAVETGGMSYFLGFQYKRELEITGQVLGIISLLCLIATVLSYAIYRNARTGTPTTILLHLCVALITLSSMLIIINFTNSTIDKVGCTLSNIARYYLVFVTLMWNGVEAFNMYLMLIKVFKNQISHFIVKAAIVAWGTPLVMIGVCLAINKNAFNGKYVVVNETMGECVFKCQLRNGTLYFGYLLPMCGIILLNLCVFGLVLRILLRHGTRVQKSNKKKLSMVARAMTTLALLGIPWIFSAFGAIDSTKHDKLEMMEGVFQVIFVVTVNLQGIFIFIFHCVRNSKIRASWRSTISGASMTSWMTKSSQSTSSRKYTAENNNSTSSNKRWSALPVDTVIVKNNNY